MRIGANYTGNGKCEFVVWAPLLCRVALKILSPSEKILELEGEGKGYWRVIADNIRPGARYIYRLDGEIERPDPASCFQPEGVHGPSQVTGRSFKWADRKFKGIPLEEMVIYELHTGTFTPGGTFDAVIPRLDELADTGINTIEIMPVAQFPGERNWGYDGVYPFAVQNSYGGPEGLKRLVNAAHNKGISVLLDVVYNHLGPEGNYLSAFGPYFSARYRTLWGEALNFDGQYSDEVRNYFTENALYWLREFHIDGLRLDAVHAIFDMSASPFLRELAEKVDEFSKKQGREYYLTSESNLNDIKLLLPASAGGYGHDAQWHDDFHHSMHPLLTGERTGRYVDYGKTEHFVKTIRDGFVYTGQYSRFRKRRYGSSSENLPAKQFIVFAQNHDQVGGRMPSARLSKLVSFETLKLAAGAVVLSPYIPLLFMGEEYGEETPFAYFTSHSDAALINSVREGRKREFKDYGWKAEPPDPNDPGEFLRSKLAWERRAEGKHKTLLELYKELIILRKSMSAFSRLDKKKLKVDGLEEKHIVVARRWFGKNRILLIMNFSGSDETFILKAPRGKWIKLLDSADKKWLGPGPLMLDEIKSKEVTIRAKSFALYKGS